MKNFILLLTGIFIFFFTEGHDYKDSEVILTKDETDNTLFSIMDDSLNYLETLSNPLSIIHGVWVITDYIKEIEKTKSPLKSKDVVNSGIVTMVIRTTDNMKDSLSIGASWNNHEGTEFMLYYIAGNQKNSLKTNLRDYYDKSNYYELGYEITLKDIILYLYHYNKTNRLLDRKQFTKIQDEQLSDDLAWGIQFIVNEKLFSGNYIVKDSLDKKLFTVQFNSDGTVTGFNDFTSYEISTDFNGWSPWEYMDDICFDIGKETAKCYAYKINGNSIDLYGFTYNEEIGLSRIDDLVFKLFRE